MVEQSSPTSPENHLPELRCLKEWGQQYVDHLIAQQPEILEGLTTDDLLDGDWAEIINRASAIRDGRFRNWDRATSPHVPMSHDEKMGRGGEPRRLTRGNRPINPTPPTPEEKREAAIQDLIERLARRSQSRYGGGGGDTKRNADYTHGMKRWTPGNTTEDPAAA
jgi:hypothetical protein